MFRCIIALAGLAGLAAVPVVAQEVSATRTSGPSPIYYGGSISLGFGSAFRIGAFPLVGVRVTPQLSLGAQVGYEYANYDGPGGETSNYGAAVFGRYRVIPQFYVHAEGRYVSYELLGPGDGSRSWVPFVLLGGGFVQPLSRRTSAYVEALFDVLQDDTSPYNDWEPFVRVGVAVGF